MTRELAKRVKRLEDKSGEAEERRQIEKSIREIEEYLHCLPEKLERVSNPIAIIACVVCTAVSLWWFRRKKWL